MPLVYCNGELLEEHDASVSVLDHGFVVGDGVFETVLLHHGRPFRLAAHLERLAVSARGLGLRAPDAALVRGAVDKVLGASDWADARIRITYTAGLGPLGSGRLENEPTLVVALGPLGTIEPASSVLAVPDVRNERGPLVGLKTTSYAEHALLLARAAACGADEAVFGNRSGMLCEGTGSNVFVVRSGELVTPPLSSGCLAGITRAVILEAGLGAEADVAFADFAEGPIEEAFLTSTLRGVQAIAAVGSRRLDATLGPWTVRARQVYDEALAGSC